MMSSITPRVFVPYLDAYLDGHVVNFAEVVTRLDGDAVTNDVPFFGAVEVRLPLGMLPQREIACYLVRREELGLAGSALRYEGPVLVRRLPKTYTINLTVDVEETAAIAKTLVRGAVTDQASDFERVTAQKLISALGRIHR